MGSSFVWGPLSTAATGNLPRLRAGAGSGVYNTTRQVGAVLGSAAISAMIQARLAANLPRLPGGAAAATSMTGTIPAQLAGPFSTAMGQAVLLPAGIALIGIVCALLLAKPHVPAGWGRDAAAAPGAGRAPGGDAAADQTR